jgi:hypothetical protein
LFLLYCSSPSWLNVLLSHRLIAFSIFAGFSSCSSIHVLKAHLLFSFSFLH